MLGSAPHTWGILWSCLIWEDRNRFTPTYMGNTSSSSNDYYTFSVHPHIHGEYALTQAPQVLRAGSPPHTWGIRIRRYRQPLPGRFTPTYMGNTSASIFALPAVAVHPHIHGEYRNPITELLALSGSPPHTWGIRHIRPPWSLFLEKYNGSPPHTWGILPLSL